ncbi:MAG: DNA gyrase subunit A [candidate division WOR-3 bacterium]
MAERLTPVYIEDEIKSSYLDYAMSVIVGRALPDVRDGLKPVQRRILYAMKELGLLPNRPFKKSATVIGDVLGKYHPHGDMAIYDALTRMAQDFSLRYPLIDGQGNFGSIDGDAPAAYRYTEARLAGIAIELLNDLEKDTVDFIPNYDGRLKEPSVLPAALPHLLANGSSGIAVGMATNIPPHNIGELIDGLIAVIENPEIKTKDLMKYIQGPDFPTGGIIIGRDGIRESYETGRGKVIIRGKVGFEEKKGGKEQIIIGEIPYQINKTALIERIANLVKEKKIEDISDLRDESDKEGMRIVIELKRDANREVVLNQLYQYTPLQSTFGIIILALVDNVPKILPLKEALQHFIDFRIAVIIRRTKFELAEAEKKAHILEGLKIAISHIDAVVNLIKTSKDTDEARVKLMKRFKLTEVQAQAILDMKLARLTGLEKDKLEEEYLALIKEIERLKSILASKAGVIRVIKNELLELKKRYGDSRRTQIIEGKVEELTVEDLIALEDMVITRSHRGYIKRQAVSIYRKQTRGGVGRTITDIGDEDFAEELIVSQTHDHLLFFTDQGKAYCIKVYEIPEAGPLARGRFIANLIELQKDEKITAVLPVKDFSTKQYIFMSTMKGTVKKVPLEDFANTRRKGIIAINLEKGDSLITAELTDGKSDIVLVTRQGLSVKFSEKDVRPMGRNATGVIGVRLEKDDSVCGSCLVRPKEQLLIVTRNGYGKRTAFEEFRFTKRGAKGVIAIKLDKKTGEIAGAMSVAETDEIILMTKEGNAIRTPVAQIRILGRPAKGVRVMTLKEQDQVVDIARVREES